MFPSPGLMLHSSPVSYFFLDIGYPDFHCFIVIYGLLHSHASNYFFKKVTTDIKGKLNMWDELYS